MAQPSSVISRVPGWAWCVTAVAVAGASIGSVLAQDWVPIDEGTLVLSARYVSAGFLPHRDFAYPYTGGLAFIGALASRLFGDTMLAARLVLFVAMIPWLCGVFAIARRHCAPPVAALAVMLAAWWSLLVYRAAMPTWYLLFLSTAATLALLMWSETKKQRWLFVAGLACGAAIAIKQTGLFTVVGAGLGVLAIRQEQARGPAAPAANPVVLLLLLAALAVPALLVVRRGVGSGEVLALAVPLAAVLLALLARERRSGSGSSTALVRAWGFLVAGACVLPAILFLIYLSQGAVSDLIAGLGGGTLRTARFLDLGMPSLWEMVRYGAPVLVVALALMRIGPSRSSIVISIAATAVFFALAWKTDAGYRAIWHFSTFAVPAAALWYALLERRNAENGAPPVTIPVVASAMVLHALNQFPLGFANYFAYVAPLAFLLIAVTAAHAGVTRRLVFVGALLVAFGGWFNRIGGVATIGFGPIWWNANHALPGPHAGVTATEGDSATYWRLDELVRAHGGADSVAAGPELVSLYAIAGTTRVVRQPYLLVDDAGADSAALAAQLDVAATRAVAIQHEPLFLPRITPSAAAWLASRYPNAERVGTIEFRWR